MEDNTRVVLPGDRITTSVDTESPVVIGPGLRQEGEHIVALKAGLLRHIPQGNRWWIENSQKRVSLLAIYDDPTTLLYSYMYTL